MKVYIAISLCLFGVNQFELKSNNKEAQTTLTVNIKTDTSQDGFVYVALHNKSETFSSNLDRNIRNHLLDR